VSAKDRVGIHFTTKYEVTPTSRVRVPSRLNLIGEHTDYNDGFVLPFAVDREMWIAFRPRLDQTVHIRSESLGTVGNRPGTVRVGWLSRQRHSDGRRNVIVGRSLCRLGRYVGRGIRFLPRIPGAGPAGAAL